MELKITRLISSLLVAIFCLCVAEAVDPDVEESMKLRPYFEKLNKILSDNTETYLDDPIKTAKKLSEYLKEEDPELGAANELFISLEDTEKNCDRESYQILSRNFFANGGPDFDGGKIGMKLFSYRDRHAKFCRSTYMEKFVELYQITDEKWLDAKYIVEKAFDGLSLRDFVHRPNSDRESMKPESLVKARVIDFTSESSKPAIKKIISNLVEWAKEMGHRRDIKTKIIRNLVALVKEMVNRQGIKTKINEKSVSKRIFDEFLLTSCIDYRERLSEVLDPAGFDAFLSDPLQEKFINEDENFRRALINNKLCSKMLKQRDQLLHLVT